MSDAISAAINTYIRDIQDELKHKEAREHAYRPALKKLLESLGDFHAVNDAAHIKGVGAPDFIIKRDNLQVAYAEAKDVGENLDEVEKSDQVKNRYLPALHNFILTDYVEFRWYYNGQKRATARLGTVDGAKLHVDDAGLHEVANLLYGFATAVIPQVYSAEELAKAMAGITRHIARLIEDSLARGSRQLAAQKEAFEKTLIPNLTDRQFADMYAQTLAYGLFAARMEYVGQPEAFTLETAFWRIPQTNPFLKDFFQHIAPQTDEGVRWQVDALAELLAYADTDTILEGFGHRTGQKDPIFHFYETFLGQYDAALREGRGVYYTPEPVVSYIVRSVDHILREKFGRYDGLAADDVYVLDPATGTGTFLYFVIQQIYEWVVEENGQAGQWGRYVQEKLLPRLFGFELLMAPYAVAHMKLGLQLTELLQQTGHPAEFGQRLGLYLTNTLEELHPENQPNLPLANFISEEGEQAAAVKREKPIMVVLGNPPYSYESSNTGEWISNLVRDYYVVDGEGLGERNPRGLQDDYVKFIRFGQWRVNQTGEGILAFVTNNGFLDNPTFRGMRQQLMSEFSEIYILDLHGNARKNEVSPDGSPDVNVFDIQQGVSITLLIRENSDNDGKSRIFHTDLWGLRQYKYDGLTSNDISTTNWLEIFPQSPFYLFTPQSKTLKAEYDEYWSVTKLFSSTSTGVKTHRDHFVIDMEKVPLYERIGKFRNLKFSDSSISEEFDLNDTRDWKLSERRKSLSDFTMWHNGFTQFYYRPFDIREIYYHRDVIELPRTEIMQHILKGDNLTMGIGRQGLAVNDPTWHLITVCKDMPIDTNVFRRGGVNAFPIYLYRLDNANNGQASLFDAAEAHDWPLSAKNRRPNLSKAFVDDFAERLGLEFVTEGVGDLETTFGPEAVFHYAYAVFHSPTYRERYAEFLKIDFPRLPLTSDVDLFRELCGFGAQLVKLHLMDAAAIGRLTTTYPVSGDDVVARGYPQYADPCDEHNGRVSINPAQYFDGVPPDIWHFHVGGYQVLEKWLKDRKGRALSSDDITHYQRIVVALGKTIDLMGQIDNAIPTWPIE